MVRRKSLIFLLISSILFQGCQKVDASASDVKAEQTVASSSELYNHKDFNYSDYISISKLSDNSYEFKNKKDNTYLSIATRTDKGLLFTFSVDSDTDEKSLIDGYFYYNDEDGSINQIFDTRGMNYQVGIDLDGKVIHIVPEDNAYVMREISENGVKKVYEIKSKYHPMHTLTKNNILIFFADDKNSYLQKISLDDYSVKNIAKLERETDDNGNFVGERVVAATEYKDKVYYCVQKAEKGSEEFTHTFVEYSLKDDKIISTNTIPDELRSIFVKDDLFVFEDKDPIKSGMARNSYMMKKEDGQFRDKKDIEGANILEPIVHSYIDDNMMIVGSGRSLYNIDSSSMKYESVHLFERDTKGSEYIYNVYSDKNILLVGDFKEDSNTNEKSVILTFKTYDELKKEYKDVKK